MKMKLAALALALASPVLAQPSQAQPAGWTLAKGANTPDKTCSARKVGSEINTVLMRNRDGQMILGAARSDWNETGAIMLKLAIDGTAPVNLAADRLGPLVLLKITDPGLETRLKSASSLAWSLPWGEFTANVVGLGEAYGSLDVC
jgi:hypothetical protein